MKQCPRCHRKYADDTIAFCLDDGTPLLLSTEQEPTLTIPAPRVTEPMSPMTSPIPSAQPQIIKQGVSPFYAYALVGLVAILIGAGVVAFFYESKKDNATTATKTVETPAPSASPNNSPVKTQTTDQNKSGQTEQHTSVSSSVPGKYPEGSTRLLTASDLAGKTAWELKVMRNEIYARHGYIFKNAELKNYFEQQSWYKPVADDVTNLLSNIEKENAEFLKNYQ